jgi:hypothetical protein
VCLVASLLAVGAAAEAEQGARSVTTDPAQVILGETDSVTVTLPGPPGRGAGALRTAVNVGMVEGVEQVGRRVRVRYRPPDTSFPQLLCLALWREADKSADVRLTPIPLLGRTDVPVKTRPRALVNVVVGTTTFGPATTNHRGKTVIPALVPPGVTRASVQVIDKVGLLTAKEVSIQQQPYNRLTLVAVPEGGRMRILVATCADEESTPELTVDAAPLPVRRDANGSWVALWSPPPGHERKETVTLRAALPGEPESTVERQVELGVDREVQRSVAHKKTEPAAAPSRGQRRLRLELGLFAGMLHNLGQVVGPRFVGEVGLDYRLPVGSIGLRTSVGYSWSGQTVAGPSELGDAESSVALMPVGVGLSYRLQLWRLYPFVSAGYLLQIVSTVTTAGFLDERRRVDLASGAFGLVGADYPLGPGCVTLQLGYLWSRVENVDVRLLAGGIVVDAGYRLHL